MSISRDDLINHLSGLTVLELSEIVKALEEKWGVSAAALSQLGAQGIHARFIDNAHDGSLLLT